MTELLQVHYAQTGQSTQHNNMGMREMQARAYDARNAQHLLLKAPPASGKSRALMFLALDKVMRQGLKKAIIAVPEISIGGSFADTPLSQHGFYADWRIDGAYNLCTSGNEGKVDKVLAFLDDASARYLLCTHATLRFAFERLGDSGKFNDMLLAIDEFHHTSAEEGNKLGAMVDALIQGSTAHLVAMTGSYFRGDQVPILTPEAEARFTHVTCASIFIMLIQIINRSEKIIFNFYRIDSNRMSNLHRRFNIFIRTICQHSPEHGNIYGFRTLTQQLHLFVSWLTIFCC